ncbi:MAG: hypothetical protein H0U10_07070 [Chloroflexia bacterium]|nr:hypothetical protein [Chloroflexia bacterium]
MPRSVGHYALLLLIAGILLASQLLLKRGAEATGPLSLTGLGDLGAIVGKVLTSPWLFAGYALSAFSALAWLIVLSRLDLSFAAPVLTGIYYVLLLIASRWLLQEDVHPGRWLGTALIVVGIAVIARSG